ncbi:MAG: YkgJ family cysteine cluster protein [Minicystis sp.]
MPSQGPRFDDLKIHLVVLGREHEVGARVRVGACRPIDVVPLARRVTDVITDAAVRAAEAEGRAVSCRVGCASCCRHVVPVAPIEALALAKAVKAMPAKQREAVRRRFGAAVRKMEEIGVLDAHAPPGRTQLTAIPARGKSAWDTASARYFAASIDCPFLENERCSIYADRPVACRQHLATSPPEHCKDLEGGKVETTARPVWMSEVLADLSASIADVDAKAMPLPLALEWAEAQGAALDVEVQGEDLARELLERTTAAE